MFKIMHQVVIETEPEVVYDAVTTQPGLAAWWIADCTVKAEVGFMNEFRVEGHGVNRMKVTALESTRLVEWLCCNEADDWTNTTIRFSIAAKTASSVLTFEHAGWRAQNDFFATCSYHWARHLSMLAKYCETGESQVLAHIENKEVRKVFSD